MSQQSNESLRSYRWLGFFLLKDSKKEKVKSLRFQLVRLKNTLFRMIQWKLNPKGFAIASKEKPWREGEVIWSKSVDIVHSEGNRLLEEGKLKNLKTLATKLNGAILDPNHVFSFWKNSGKFTEKNGYSLGSEVRAGCVVPSIGGGACLLSNLLFSMALDLGLEIHERHAHTIRYEKSVLALPDATLFWPYVDLRFRSNEPLQLLVSVSDEKLNVVCVASHSSQVFRTKKNIVVEYSTSSHLENIYSFSESLSRKVLYSDRKKTVASAIGSLSCLNCYKKECSKRPYFTLQKETLADQSS